jgi:hypothetical protein
MTKLRKFLYYKYFYLFIKITFYSKKKNESLLEFKFLKFLKDKYLYYFLILFFLKKKKNFLEFVFLKKGFFKNYLFKEIKYIWLSKKNFI